MTLFPLVISLFILCKSQPFSLSSNKYVSYYHSSNCPRTSWCLQLNSAAQLLGQYSWPKYLWNGNFTITFWYYSQTNNNSSTTHNIISNCHSNGVASNITSFLLATETMTDSPKTSNFDVYFNNSQQCTSIHSNNAQCSSQHVMINNVWQYITIIYQQKTGFYVYSNNTLWNNITWNDTKQNRNPIQSNNVLCIGDGDMTNNYGFIQLLSDIRFYNKSINKATMKHLFDLNYDLTHSDNDGVFVYYDFIQNTTTNNMKNLCLQLFYIHKISPKSISLNSGDIIYLYGNFGADITSDNIVIVLYDKYDSKFILNISTSSIISVSSNQISFNISHSSLNNKCSDKIYINITSTINNCFINNKNVSISTYSPSIRVLPDQLPAINYFNISIQSQCIPPHDNKLHCYLYLNNIKRDISAKILSTSEIICKFTDLSSLLPSTNYNLQIYSLTYNYTTLSNKISIYNAPSIKELSSTSFTDNEEASVLLVYGSNFIYSQPFYCNFLDPKDPNKLIYHSKGEITANGAYVSCLISTNLIPPSTNYKFYLSSENYFNSSKIPIIIKNSAPYLINTIFIFNNSDNNIYPSSSLQYFYTQIVDEAYNNFTYSPNGYKYSMFSWNCVSIQFVMHDMGNGILNWSYVAPPAFNQNNFSCDINFTAFDMNEEKFTSFILFNLQFQTFKPHITDINNTLFLINNITDFRFKLSNLYIDNYEYYYYKYNNMTYILSNNMSIKCVFTNAKNSSLKFESFAVLLSDDRYNNIQNMHCPQVIISEVGQYIFQFKIIQFKQIYLTDAYNKANSIIFAYKLPTFDAGNFNSSKHIYLYGSNLFIGANALHINEWDVKCNFGNDILFSTGHVINETAIFCSMPDIDHTSLSNVISITITYYKYIDDNHNVYQTFAPLLFLTNLSLSFTTTCPGNNCHGNGYCDYDGVCHCNIGYSGDDCHMPLYYVILCAIIMFFTAIIIILLYCCRKYQTQYHRLKVKYQAKQLKNMKNKYYGYKPISDKENFCCCLNFNPGHFGYYFCCQFCCFCDEKIIQIKLDDHHDSITYTSTFHGKFGKLSSQYQQQQHFVNHKSNVYSNINNNGIYNGESDSESEQCELSVGDQQLSVPVPHQYH